MELRRLEYFAAVARHGSFTRAAEELWLTQSALSQQIRRLEAELGVALLRRTPRGAELTPAGEALLPRAEACASSRRRSTRRDCRRRSPPSTASTPGSRSRCARRRPPRSRRSW